MNAYLQEERERCQQLASQLGREQQGAESRVAESARLAALAQRSTEEVMEAREAAQAERGRAEQLGRDKAELQGKVEALQETLGRLEKADNVLLRLTEDKAALQQQLQESQAAAEGAAKAAEERQRRAEVAEGACAELRRQLDAALSQHEVAHVAVEGAADQLQQLTASHGGLEQQLAAAGAELDAARSELARHADHAQHLEQRQLALEGQVRRSLQERDAALAQLQQLHGALGAAQQEAAEQRQLAADARQRVEADAEEREGLAERLQGLQAENSSLKENLQALEAECEAVRRLGSNVDETNQTLVDNMCDMSGLVDAVQALQQRNRLLQKDLDTLKAKYADLHRGHEQQGRSLQGAQEELGAEQALLAGLQTKQAMLEQDAAALRAELAAAQAQRDQATQQHREAERELGGLRERLAMAEGSLVESRQQADAAREQHQEAAACAGALESQLAEAQQQAVDSAAGRQQAEVRQEEMRQQLAALQKAQSIAEGRLLMAGQREAQFKEASKQLRVLQHELHSFVAEAQAHRQRQEAAEQRCRALDARCRELDRRSQQLGVQLAEATEQREAAVARQAELQEVLTAAQISVAQMEAQQETAQSVQQRLSELETEQVSAAEWFDALTRELAEKTDQLASAEVKLRAGEEEQASVASMLVGALAKLAAAEEARGTAEAARDAAKAGQAATSEGLERAEQEAGESRRQAAELQQRLLAAECEAADVRLALEGAEAGREAAQAALEEAQREVAEARLDCAQLQQRLGEAQDASAAAQQEQQHRIDQLFRGLFVTAAVHEASVRQLRRAGAEAAEQHAAAVAAERQLHATALAAAEEQHGDQLAAAAQQASAAAGEAERQHQQQVAGLQAALADTVAQLEGAGESQRAAAERCSALEKELAAHVEAAMTVQQQLADAEEAAAVAMAAQRGLERQHGAAAADAATHARAAQQLEHQCAVLREQLAFLHERQEADAQECRSLQAALTAASGAGDAHVRQLAEAQAAVQAADQEQQRLRAALHASEEAAGAVAEREGDLRQRLAAADGCAQAAQAAAQQAREQAAAVEGQAEALRQQLELEEDRRRQLEQQLDAAAEERQQLRERTQVHTLLEGLSSGLQAQLELLRRIERGPAAAPAGGHAGNASEACLLASRRELLAEALDQLQALKAESEQLWSVLEAHLSSDDGSCGGGRPNRFAAHLRAERDELACQLAAAQLESADSATRLAAAQAAIAKLRSIMERLPGGGASIMDGGWPGLDATAAPLSSLGPGFSGASLLQQAEGCPGCAAAASERGSDEPQGWQTERRLLKAVCKLALAVTMDQLAGEPCFSPADAEEQSGARCSRTPCRHEAASLAAELAPLMAAQAGTLRGLGLQKVWATLHSLALADDAGALTPVHGQHQQRALAPAAAALGQQGEAAATAWALQQRVQRYKAKCRQLQAAVVSLEGAAARWRSEAGEAERGLALLRFGLADLLSEVKWVLGDFSDTPAGGDSGGIGAACSRQLAELVEQLGRGLRRVLRKYRTLAGHLQDAREGSGHQVQQRQQEHRAERPAAWHIGSHRPVSSIDEGHGGAAAPLASQGASWGAGAGWRDDDTASSASGGGGIRDLGQSGGGSVHEAMAEAGRRAASIAAKLDQLLTPQSWAAAHGPGAAVGWRSRFAAEAAGPQPGGGTAAEQVEEQAVWGRPSQRFDLPLQQQVWPLPAGDPEEVPLRVRYASAPPF